MSFFSYVLHDFVREVFLSLCVSSSVLSYFSYLCVFRSLVLSLFIHVCLSLCMYLFRSLVRHVFV